MSEGSGVDVATLAEPIDASWAPPDRRRLLQLALAALWFLDAALQLQPFMFSRSFGLLMLGPNAQGNPGVIAHPITDVSRSIGQHSVGADTVFLVVQFLIAFGIAYRPTVRLALVGSVLWSAVVWWFGEGLGRVLTGTASPVTGAPGAVLLYAVLAILLWPTDPRRDDGPFTAARVRWAPGPPKGSGSPSGRRWPGSRSSSPRRGTPRACCRAWPPGSRDGWAPSTATPPTLWPAGAGCSPRSSGRSWWASRSGCSCRPHRPGRHRAGDRGRGRHLGRR